MSVRAYARRRGVSEAAVRRALTSHRISKAADGKIDPDQADRDWAANTDESKPRASSPASSETVSSSFNRFRAQRERWNARRARLEVRRREGELIEREAVRTAMFEAARAAREKLMGVPARLAPMVAGLTDIEDCHRAIEKEILDVCRDLAKTLPGTVPSESPPVPGI